MRTGKIGDVLAANGAAIDDADALMDWVGSSQYTHLLRTRAYLTSLPSGLASYPECCGKASVWRNILDLTDTSSLVDRLPEDLAELLQLNLPYGAWLPVAKSFAGHLLLRDCLFSTDEAIYEHFRHVDRKLLSGVLYKMLFAVVSPGVMIQASDRRFGTLFKGIDFRTRTIGKDRVEVELSYPVGLVPPLVGRLYLIAFEVAVELSGGIDVHGKLLMHRPTSSRYELSWR
jgi:hypothetical protein